MAVLDTVDDLSKKGPRLSFSELFVPSFNNLAQKAAFYVPFCHFETRDQRALHR